MINKNATRHGEQLMDMVGGEEGEGENGKSNKESNITIFDGVLPYVMVHYRM